MGLFDNMKRLFRPYEDDQTDEYDEYEDEEEYEEEYEEEEPAPEPPPRREERERFRATSSERTSRRSYERASRQSQHAQEKRASSGSMHTEEKVVSINTNAKLSVVLAKPTDYSKIQKIGDHLKSRHTVVLNLENISQESGDDIRILDFLSGVAYAQNGAVKRVAMKTFIVTPYDIAISGDLLDEFGL